MPKLKWEFKQAEEALNGAVQDQQTIFVFEADSGGLPIPYALDDILEFLFSKDSADRGVRLDLIAKMIELQDAQDGAKDDLKKRYEFLIHGLDAEALHAIRNTKPRAIKTWEDAYEGPTSDGGYYLTSEKIEQFLVQLGWDWVHTKPEDMLKGPHIGGQEYPQKGPIEP